MVSSGGSTVLARHISPSIPAGHFALTDVGAACDDRCWPQLAPVPQSAGPSASIKRELEYDNRFSCEDFILKGELN